MNTSALSCHAYSASSDKAIATGAPSACFNVRPPFNESRWPFCWVRSRSKLALAENFFRVPRIGGTIPHAVQGEAAAGVVLLKPASPGTGVIAGGPVRAVLECAGIHDVLSRSLGSSNPINVVHATVAALKSLNRPEEIAAKRGLPIEDVAPAAMLRARAAAAGS